LGWVLGFEEATDDGGTGVVGEVANYDVRRLVREGCGFEELLWCNEESVALDDG
jgi:hypothetical protein